MALGIVGVQKASGSGSTVTTPSLGDALPGDVVVAFFGFDQPFDGIVADSSGAGTYNDFASARSGFDIGVKSVRRVIGTATTGLTVSVTGNSGGLTIVAWLIRGLGAFNADQVNNAEFSGSTAATVGPLAAPSGLSVVLYGFAVEASESSCPDAPGFNAIANGFDSGMLANAHQETYSAGSSVAVMTGYKITSGAETPAFTLPTSAQWFANAASFLIAVTVTGAVLDGALTRLVAINPVFVNDNVGASWRQDKLGPECPVRFAEGNWREMIEGVAVGPVASTGAASGSDPLSMTLVQDSAIFSPVSGENSESTITSVWWYPPSGRFFGLYHAGGNSPGKRQIYLVSTNDSTLNSGWTRENGGAPVIAFSATSGSFYEHGLADIKAQLQSDGTLLAFFRGVEATANYGRVGRATSSDNGLTWSVTSTSVIALGASGTWCDVEHLSPDWVRDPDGRLHLWAPGTSSSATYQYGAIGYYYSDDNGVTWTAGVNNPVTVGTGVSTDPDRYIGDTLALYNDGPDLYLGYMGYNASYSGVRLEGRVRAWIGYTKTVPAIPARHTNLASGTTQYVSVPDTGALLGQTAFSVLIEFKAAKHNTYREMYTEQLNAGAYASSMLIRINNSGFLECNYRGGGSVIGGITSAARFDDNKRHWALWVRRSSTDFQLYTRDAAGGAWTSQGTYTGTSAGTATTVGGGAWFGWNVAANGQPNEMFGGSLAVGVTLRGRALTTAEADAYIAKEAMPSGVTDYTAYRFGASGSTTVETDRSSNARNGTVVGSIAIVDFAIAQRLAPPQLRTMRAMQAINRAANF